jgi:muramoyltetrapeptide carboxypeptidase
MLVAPAGPAKKELILQYQKRLEAMGFRVVVPEGLFRRTGYLAGSDKERADELNAAIKDPTINGIFPCSGGYGATRILELIDYAALRKNRPVLIGFSDITALHLAIARKARLVTFHSPLPQHDLWLDDEAHRYTTQSFWRCVLRDSYKEKQADGFVVAVPAGQPGPKKLVGGKTRGRLQGGNLTLICATLGTPYAINAKGCILLLEDTGEKPYRTDRALSQLRLAGVLDEVAGVIVGDFSATDKEDTQRVLREYLSGLKVPVITNFPVGHLIHNATLPHGGLVELDADAPAVRVLENPVKLE